MKIGYAKNDIYVREAIDSGNYMFNSDGELYSRFSRQGHLLPDYKLRKLSPWRTHLNYLSINYKGHKLSIHRLSYYYFNRTINPLKQVHHLDGNPANNRPENLVLLTQTQNMRLKPSQKVIPAGTGIHVLSQAQAEEVRRLAMVGWTHKELAFKFQCSRDTIRSILAFKTYK